MRAGNTCAVDVGDGRHLLDFEAVLESGGLQRFKIAGAFCAVAEVVADHHPARMQAVHDHVLNERGRRLAGEGVIEVLDNHAIHTVRAQRFELVTQHGDARRRAGRIEEFAGMRLEGHHADRQATCIGRRAHVGEQRLMATMDTVEIADGQRAGRTALGIGQAAEDSHDIGWVGG